MKKVSFEDVLAYREKRARRREELLSKYSLPLACFDLNIPGEYADFPWALRSFHDGLEAFTLALEAEGMGILYEERNAESLGCTADFSVSAAPDSLKALALRVEETHPLGRLFDIDVYEPGGMIYRQYGGVDARPCLVCGKSGFLSARGCAHSPLELRFSAEKLMEGAFRQKLADLVSQAAIWAMMSEAAITPKPGLIDRMNSGAHEDMNYFTLIDSASALLPWFRSSALAGFDSGGKGQSARSLFEALRPAGRIAEVLMKRAAGGVNAHKGYIFSLGVLSAAYGRLYRIREKPDLDEVLEFSKEMTCTLGEDFSRLEARKGSAKEPSHGEEAYERDGILGIRGEVSLGFPTVKEKALPLLHTMLEEGYSLNDSSVAVLLKLLAHAEDTNFIHRGGLKALAAVQEDLVSFFADGPDMEQIWRKAAALDGEFIPLNLSPGGSADLLGITLFLYRLFGNNSRG